MRIHTRIWIAHRSQHFRNFFSLQNSSNEPTCDTSNEPEQLTSDHSNVDVPIETSSTDEPPHTPIVSAIADGPSIDIMPKLSKNIKRT